MWRGAARSTWIGAPEELDVDAAVAAGEDVAILELDADAPPGEPIRDVALDYVAVNDQPVQFAGYGLTDLQSGRLGVRTVGDGRVTGCAWST